ncbi:31505_t:CDS:1, partial [Gigaspora margarita]
NYQNIVENSPKCSIEYTKNSNYPTSTNSKTKIYTYKREQSVNSNERKQTMR